MRAHKSKAAVAFGKVSGVKLASSPKEANYDFIIASGPNKRIRVEFIYTADKQEASDMLNLYFIKGRSLKNFRRKIRSS